MYVQSACASGKTHVFQSGNGEVLWMSPSKQRDAIPHIATALVTSSHQDANPTGYDLCCILISINSFILTFK